MTDVRAQQKNREDRQAENRAAHLNSQSKCARRIRWKKKTSNPNASNAVHQHARPVAIHQRDRHATTLAAISTNSMPRRNASPRALGNSSARFFVHPSHICGKLRYIRVLTTSDEPKLKSIAGAASPFARAPHLPESPWLPTHVRPRRRTHRAESADTVHWQPPPAMPDRSPPAADSSPPARQRSPASARARPSCVPPALASTTAAPHHAARPRAARSQSTPASAAYRRR